MFQHLSSRHQKFNLLKLIHIRRPNNKGRQQKQDCHIGRYNKNEEIKKVLYKWKIRASITLQYYKPGFF